MTQQPNQTSTGGRLGFAGSLDFRDAHGNVLKTIEIKGSVPLADLGLTEQQAAELVAQQAKEQ